MQSRAARLILLCLFFAAISTATFLFWKGNTEATATALDAKTSMHPREPSSADCSTSVRRSWRTPRPVNRVTAG